MQNPDELVVGANGAILVAPLGSPLPASISAPLSDAWVDLGYADDSGVVFHDGKTMVSILGWQTLYDLRRLVTARETTAHFVLQQWNGGNIKLAYGGGEIVEDGVGEFRYAPPDAGFIDERMLAVEWQDGEKDYRMIIAKSMVTDNVDTTLNKKINASLPITLGLIAPPAGQDPWFMQTNDPSFADFVEAGS